MKFTAQEEYGLRCMLQFARHCTRGAVLSPLAPPEGTSGGHEGGDEGSTAEGSTAKDDRPSLTIGEIAEIEGLTPQYAGKLIRILRIGGLLESVRGRHGGYRVARSPAEISVAEVLAALGGRIFEPAYCSRYPGDRKLCVHTVDCAIRSLWGMLQGTMDRILSRIKLQDLMGSEKKASEWMGSLVEAREMVPAGSEPVSREAPSLLERAGPPGMVEVQSIVSRRKES